MVVEWLSADVGVVDWFARRTGYRPGRNRSVDWCRFRRDQHCWYPIGLDEEASAVAGYAVWIPQDRGYCPRNQWAEQQLCPAPSEPGPHSGESDARPDATVSWAAGGQRVDIRHR